jgi:hypothetical protein
LHLPDIFIIYKRNTIIWGFWEYKNNNLILFSIFIDKILKIIMR